MHLQFCHPCHPAKRPAVYRADTRRSAFSSFKGTALPHCAKWSLGPPCIGPIHGGPLFQLQCTCNSATPATLQNGPLCIGPIHGEVLFPPTRLSSNSGGAAQREYAKVAQHVKQQPTPNKKQCPLLCITMCNACTLARCSACEHTIFMLRAQNRRPCSVLHREQRFTEDWQGWHCSAYNAPKLHNKNP